MYCPNCGSKCEDGHKFCFRCGTRLPQISSEPAEPIEEIQHAPAIDETEQAAVIEDTEIQSASVEETALPPVSEEAMPAAIEDPPAPPPKRKGRLWPPMLVIALMIVLGLSVFFLTNNPKGKDPTTPWFQVKNGTLYFDAALYSGSSKLTVPETIGGQTVTALSDGCFAQCSKLTTVILPDTITEIGAQAFAQCTSMRGIFIPESVETIGEKTFYGCQSLEAICIPGSMASIGSQAFGSCENLHHIFFMGSFLKWTSLYLETIAADTMVYCTDGVYPHPSWP